MSHKKVTVLIPNYNGARFLARTLQSLDAQTYEDFVVQVWDDGSTDESVSIAEDFARVRDRFSVIRNENVGIGASWNRAVSHVESPYFTILHCDDEYHPEYLRTLTVLLDQYSSAGVAHCPAVCIDERSNERFSALESYKKTRFFPAESGVIGASEAFRALLQGNFINCPSTIYRTEAVKKIGPFNETLLHCLDWEYWFRNCLAGYDIAFTDKTLFRYRRHDENASRTNSKTLIRYREEQQLLSSMTDIGTETFGWHQEASLTPVFQGALSDIEFDLLRGQYGDAESKRAMLLSINALSEFQDLALGGVISLRRFGGVLLSAAITTAVCLLLATSHLKKVWR